MRLKGWTTVLVALAALCAMTACGEDSDDPPAQNTPDAGPEDIGGEDAPEPADDVPGSDVNDVDPEPDPDPVPATSERVITADWLAGTLTVFDYADLVAGGDADSAIVSTIDVSEHSPGPIELELTPDGTRAVVTTGPGFFDGVAGAFVGSPEIPEGGGLLIVDLASGQVEARIETADIPMGIAISPDGTRAYTANFGRGGARGQTMSVIDLENGTLLEDIVVGGGPEQVVLDESGALGVINLASEGGVKIFETASISDSLSPLIETGGDPSDIAVFGGFAVVINSQSFTAALVDVERREGLGRLSLSGGGFPYGIDRVPGKDMALVTASADPSALIPVTTEGGNLIKGDRIELSGAGFPLNTAIDDVGHFAFVPHPADGAISVVNLRTGESRAVPFLETTGPTYIAID